MRKDHSRKGAKDAKMLKIGRKFFPCLARALVPNGDMFLFVVVSRQTKKGILCVLCVSAVKCPNPYLR